ncbi:MAG: alcohol dehydrogenase catalytic domain-containing protein [Thermoleophilia bacterium]
MRALILEGPDDLRLRDVPRPEPGPGEVVVRVAAALTCATDRKMMARGHHPALPPTPCPFGHECAGHVHAVGPGVAGWRPGDRVTMANSAPCGACAFCAAGRAGLCTGLVYLTGAFAEFIRVPAPIVRTNLMAVPDDMPLPLAAMVEPVACGVRAVHRSAAAPGDPVLVLGGGLQGQAITAALAARGCDVVVCDPHGSRRELALRMGARAAHPVPGDPEAERRMSEGCGPIGPRAVFCAVGALPAWESAVRMAGPGGEVNLHGGPPPGGVLHADADRLHYSEITLQASYHHDPRAVRDAFALLRDGGRPFEALLAGRVGLEDVPQLLRTSRDKHIVIPG